ncbi:hypothetical protein [Amycolatopsis sp.]|uniref:hypothetical protein n=1 Tax=Amycolatopsis sp. TaxID=37632 RepID=UPI002E0504EE|nr:hypothetical protein [Amycolatopsis sp.]
MSMWNSETTTKLLELVAREGSPGKRDLARDVLAGRHSLRDLAYLSSGPGDNASSMAPLLDRWEKTSEQERGALVEGSDQAMDRIADKIRTIEIDEPTPPEPTRPPRRPRPEENDDDTFFADKQWFG